MHEELLISHKDQHLSTEASQCNTGILSDYPNQFKRIHPIYKLLRLTVRTHKCIQQKLKVKNHKELKEVHISKNMSECGEPHYQILSAFAEPENHPNNTETY